MRVVRDPASARHARVVVLRRDPLADPVPTPWPLVDAGADFLAVCGAVWGAPEPAKLVGEFKDLLDDAKRP